jgi:hypothetical protein
MYSIIFVGLALIAINVVPLLYAVSRRKQNPSVGSQVASRTY